MAEFRMPSLGADMTEGTLLEWLVHPGDVVHRGDIIAVVDTSKSAIDIEVFENGTITELLVTPGTTVAVGTPLAIIDGTSPTLAGPATPDASSPVVEIPEVTPATRDEASGVGAHVAASPFARRRAAELGVDLAAVIGHGGVISVADVEAAAGHAQPAPPVDHAAGMRQAIADLMARSKRDIPHYYLQSTIDMKAALDWLARLNADRTVADRILPAALLLKATAMAVHDVPEMNGLYVDGCFKPSEEVHLGVAVSLRAGGLIAPALHDVDSRSLDEVMAGMKDLVTRARSGRLRASEMSDPTLTVTNLGEQGAEVVHGVIYPPQVALVGFGRIIDRPWAKDGMLAVHPTVVASLAADHRVSDGHRGGLLLASIDALLQEPERLREGHPR